MFKDAVSHTIVNQLRLVFLIISIREICGLSLPPSNVTWGPETNTTNHVRYINFEDNINNGLARINECYPQFTNNIGVYHIVARHVIHDWTDTPRDYTQFLIMAKLLGPLPPPQIDIFKPDDRHRWGIPRSPPQGSHTGDFYSHTRLFRWPRLAGATTFAHAYAAVRDAGYGNRWAACHIIYIYDPIVWRLWPRTDVFVFGFTRSEELEPKMTDFVFVSVISGTVHLWPSTDESKRMSNKSSPATA